MSFADSQGASEDQKFGLKTTPLNMNLFLASGITCSFSKKRDKSNILKITLRGVEGKQLLPKGQKLYGQYLTATCVRFTAHVALGVPKANLQRF